MRQFEGNPQEDGDHLKPAHPGGNGNARSVGLNHGNRRGTHRADACDFDVVRKICTDVELGGQEDDSEH